jgi:outer membrane protein
MNRQLNITVVPPARLRTVAIALGLTFLAAFAAVAQESGDAQLRKLPTTIDGFTGETPDTQSLTEALGMERTEEGVDFTLDQVITLTLQRNLTLVIQRYERSRSILRIGENQGIYDFNLQFDASLSDSTQRVANINQDAGGADSFSSETQRADALASRLFSSGGTLGLSFRNTRRAASDFTSRFNPSYDTSLNFQFDQPLLRNFGHDVTEQNIIIARTNAAVSRETFQTQVETIIRQASDGYWNLVESIEQLAVAEESLTLAEELHGMNRIQVDVGTLAPLEMVQSEAGVASRKEEIISRRAQVGDGADILRRLINLKPGPAWDTPINPVTQPEVAHQAIDVAEAVATALKNRPDIRRQKLQNETLDLQAKVAQSRKKPRLDATANYGVSGVDGTFVGADGELVNNDYSDALAQIPDRVSEGWTLAVTYAIPLGNRQAKAASAGADLAVAQGDVELQDLELEVLLDVRSAARALEAAAERIESAKVSSRLARQNLDAERKRYENGLSTTFEVLRIQEDLSEAASREVSAVINYRRQDANYYRSIGQLLDKYNVVMSDDM